MKLLTFVAIIFIININNNAAARSKNKMPPEPIKLYYLPPSPPCRAVMMLAKVLGLELDLVLTNIVEGDHMKPDYLKINPQHTVPTMDDNGFTLWESRAIMSYLVTQYGRNETLYPKNTRERALVDQRLYFDIGTLYQRYMNLYSPVLFKGEELDDENIEKMDEALDWLDTFLENHHFVAGNNLTIADITIVVTITNLEAFNYDLNKYHNVNKWYSRMKKVLEPYGYKEIDHAGAQMLAAFVKN